MNKNKVKTQDETIDIYTEDFVSGLFDSMSSTYGLTNYISSFGFTERWRHSCIEQLPKQAHFMKGYDLMTGMGEVWASLDSRFAKAEITALDISPMMLARAGENVSRYTYQISLLQADVLSNAIPDHSADFVISTFGLKTFNEAQQSLLADEVVRILKPGGVFSFVEISVPNNILRPFYMFYLKRVIPVIGRLFQGNADNYRMLGRYTSNFKDCSTFFQLLADRGLNVRFTNYFWGCATGVSGSKPSQK
ncbi:MAG: class I SAM-dependent methyltransferase [Hymenobacteraceae bacterium]|nr:class I SAM-dependent methyltransferase [Hymenobacteraceae bacterium]